MPLLRGDVPDRPVVPLCVLYVTFASFDEKRIDYNGYSPADLLQQFGIIAIYRLLFLIL
jgi:hypothetical protein